MSSTDHRYSLAEAFTAEHHRIDAGIQAYLDAGPDDPRRGAAHLESAMAALRRHIYLEEQIVFPHLPDGPLKMALLVMYREHGQLWRGMDELSAQLDADDAGRRADGCRRLLALLERHNAKEEPIIYPHMDADLDEFQQTQVRSLLGTGTLPEGWTPREA